MPLRRRILRLPARMTRLARELRVYSFSVLSVCSVVDFVRN